MEILSSRNSLVRSSVASIFRSTCLDSYNKWAALFWEASGVNPNLRQEFHSKIAKQYDFILPDEANAGSKLLFAIQTFFAEFVKRFVRERLNGLSLSDPFFSWSDVIISNDLLSRFSEQTADDLDFFAKGYQQLYPVMARKALGEFYTPDWLAKYLIRQIDDSNGSILDPACGSGIFLSAAIERLQSQNIDSDEILNRIRGFDLNPLAVLMARANIALKLGLRQEKVIPVFLKDSILDNPNKDEYQAFNIVGNPPWLNWDRLSKQYRDKTKPLWEYYGLFNLSGNEARYGGSKKELAQLMIYRIADQYLKQKGKLSVVLPLSVFQTRKSGEGFRRFLLPNGTPLNVLAVDDFSEIKPPIFTGVGTKPATLFLEKGYSTEFPVPIKRWKTRTQSESFRGEPTNTNLPGSPWKIGKKSLQSNSKIESRGPSDYQAYLGANTGGANGVYWLEIIGPSNESDRLIKVHNLPKSGKLELPQVEAEIEKDLIFPLLRWSDVDRFQAKKPSRFILLSQEPKMRTGISLNVMQKKYPAALDYLKRFKTELRNRAAFRKYQSESPFYSMYNIGQQTLAPFKVVWRRMDRMLRAAVLEPMEHPLLGTKPIIPQETCVLIPCQTKEEAEYLVDLLNGNEVAEVVESLGVVGSKGFGSPGILNDLGIRRFTKATDL